MPKNSGKQLTMKQNFYPLSQFYIKKQMPSAFGKEGKVMPYEGVKKFLHNPPKTVKTTGDNQCVF